MASPRQYESRTTPTTLTTINLTSLSFLWREICNDSFLSISSPVQPGSCERGLVLTRTMTAQLGVVVVVVVVSLSLKLVIL